MKLIISILLLIPLFAYSQSDSIKVDSVICLVPIEPQFPGGIHAMRKYCNENFEYPVESIANEEQGVIWVEFFIDEVGNVVDVKIIKGVSELLDEESIRVIKSMPKWSPGMKNGKPIRTRYTIPITAKLT